MYPNGLQSIVSLFESLLDREKREALVSYADQVPKWRPKDGENFDLEDVRKDEECTDTVGVFLKVDGDERVLFRVTLGSQCPGPIRLKHPVSFLTRGPTNPTNAS